MGPAVGTMYFSGVLLVYQIVFGLYPVVLRMELLSNGSKYSMLCCETDT